MQGLHLPFSVFSKKTARAQEKSCIRAASLVFFSPRCAALANDLIKEPDF